MYVCMHMYVLDLFRGRGNQILPSHISKTTPQRHSPLLRHALGHGGEHRPGLLGADVGRSAATARDGPPGVGPAHADGTSSACQV